MSDQARGSELTVTLFDETVAGTPPGTPAGRVVGVAEFGLSLAREQVQSRTLTGDRNRKRAKPGTAAVGGNIVFELWPEGVYPIFKHLFGGVATSGGPTFTHTFTTDKLPPGMTIEKDNGPSITGVGRYVRYHGVRINSATLNIPANGIPELSCDCVGMSRTESDTPLDASPLALPVDPWGMAEGIIEEASSELGEATSCSFQIANEIQLDNYTINSNGSRVSQPEGYQTVSGTLQALFKDTYLLGKAIADTPTDVLLKFRRGIADGTAGNEFMDWKLQNLTFAPNDGEIRSPQGVRLDLPFQGFGDSATPTMEVTLMNTDDGTW